MLMDEPFAAVDPIVRARLQDQFLDIQDDCARRSCSSPTTSTRRSRWPTASRILNMGGMLEQYAPPEEILREPANDFVGTSSGPSGG